MTDKPKVEDMRCILYNGDTYINKKDLVSAMRKICIILEEPYGVYLLNNLCAKLNDKNIIMKYISGKFETKIIEYKK